MPAKRAANAEQQLKDLLSDEHVWAAAADVLRDELDTSDLSQAQIAETLNKDKSGNQVLSLSQPTISRLIRREPTPRLRKALLKNPHGLSELLKRIGLQVDELKRRAVSQGLHLCIDRPSEDFESVECSSIRFRAAGNQAIPIPMDPRTDRSRTICQFCHGTLSAECPECNARVDGASYCPKCGHRYVAGTPEELRGLTGIRLVRACEKRNAKNQADRQHPENGLHG
ncbi:MAG: zinc ribbon domain-containing protein [Planctomycetes bacterium]|nr:zinc ribbon domain-containing protein [Planctomycetota bacterium]